MNYIGTKSNRRASLTLLLCLGLDTFNSPLGGACVNEDELKRLSTENPSEEAGAAFAQRIMTEGTPSSYVMEGEKGIHGGECHVLKEGKHTYLAKKDQGRVNYVSLDLIKGLRVTTAKEIAAAIKGKEVSKVKIGKRTYIGVKLSDSTDYTSVVYFDTHGQMQIVCGCYKQADKKACAENAASNIGPASAEESAAFKAKLNGAKEPAAPVAAKKLKKAVVFKKKALATA